MSSLPNELQLYFGDDFVINKYITIHQPKLNDMIRLGEKEYFSTVYAFTSIPSDMKPQLFDIGIIWEDISDFDLFIMLTHNLTPKQTGFLFGDLDLSKFKLGKNENGETVLYQLGYDGEMVVIDEYVYLRIATFLRKIHGIVPKPEKGANKTTRKIMIEDDRQRMEMQKNKGEKSSFVPIISSLINSPEFKYGLKEVREMPMYAFMDAVTRIQIIKSSTALLNGCYSGMIDTSKINKKEFNWMREIEDDK